MKSTSAIAAGLCLFATSALAETLITPPYPSSPLWKNITDKGNAQGHIREWIPANQTEANILDILTEQKFFIIKNGDPAAMVARIASGAKGNCDGLRANGPKRGTENGYPVAYGQVYCQHQKGTPFDVTIFIKAIGGHDALYVVQREFHVPTQKNGVAGVVVMSKPSDVQALMTAQVAGDKYLASAVELSPK
jgi:hypothetical protein